MTSDKKAQLKEKAKEELRLLLLISLYLAAFFAAFLTYRRLISRELGVSVLHYGYAVIEALLIAKVILIGKAIGLGKTTSRSTLAWSVLEASLLYGALVAAFEIVERIVDGLIHGKSFGAGIEALRHGGLYEVLARSIVIFVAFLPFFAFWEVARLMGDRKLFDVFFHKRVEESGAPGVKSR